MIFYLVGYMGCGKSSIGKVVARATGLRFLDMDTEVERKCGMSVSEIFHRHGQEFFRRTEREVLEQIAFSGENIVVATGGGVPCFGDNMDLILSSGHSIYMKMSPAVLSGRIKPGTMKRPILIGMDRSQIKDFVTTNLAERERHYMRASMVIDCDGVSDNYISDHIENYIRYISGKGGI